MPHMVSFTFYIQVSISHSQISFHSLFFKLNFACERTIKLHAVPSNLIEEFLWYSMGNLILHEIRLNLMTNYKVNPNNTFYKCIQVCPLTCPPVRNMTAHKKLREDKLYINSMDKKWWNVHIWSEVSWLQQVGIKINSKYNHYSFLGKKKRKRTVCEFLHYLPRAMSNASLVYIHIRRANLLCAKLHPCSK